MVHGSKKTKFNQTYTKKFIVNYQFCIDSYQYVPFFVYICGNKIISRQIYGDQRTKIKKHPSRARYQAFPPYTGQEALAAEMGLSQALISTYEQRKVLNDDVIERFAKALNVAPELIKELEEDPVTFIVENNTFEEGSIANISNVSEGNNNTITNNPIEQIIELNKEKTALYERMLELEKEKNALLEKLLEDRK